MTWFVILYFFFASFMIRSRVTESHSLLSIIVCCYLASSLMSGFFLLLLCDESIFFLLWLICFNRTRDFRIPVEHLVCRLGVYVCGNLWFSSIIVVVWLICLNVRGALNISSFLVFLVHEFPFLWPKVFKGTVVPQ